LLKIKNQNCNLQHPLSLNFYYLPMFNIVTAEVASKNNLYYNTSSILSNIFMPPSNLLTNLKKEINSAIGIYFLTKLGLVTPEFLRKYWKYAVVIILIVAAIVTPPDVVSQTIVAIPMLLIYEVSILISKIVVLNKKKENV